MKAFNPFRVYIGKGDYKTMKRKTLAMILVLCLACTSFVQAEGLLPLLTDILDKPMLSLGEALKRYPDDEAVNNDGSKTEVFREITETDFNTFSVYLSEQHAALANYNTSGSVFSASIQVDDKTISFTYDMQKREAAVTYPKGTYDRWLDYAKAQYETAADLLNVGKTNEAASIILSIPNYSEYLPVASLLATHPELDIVALQAVQAEPFKTPGNYVTFGAYPQDTDGKDSTPIEWLVLDYDKANNRALMISRYGLDTKPYNIDGVDITWEKCTLRAWLNGDFFSKAFSADEQSAIILTDVDNSYSQGLNNWSANGGNNTQDRIFLLSCLEVNRYFKNKQNSSSKVKPTDYAIKQGAATLTSYRTADEKGTGWWWLRSPGRYQNSAARVRDDGSFYSNSVTYSSGCVRPALWINLGRIPLNTHKSTVKATSIADSSPTSDPTPKVTPNPTATPAPRVPEDWYYHCAVISVSLIRESLVNRNSLIINSFKVMKYKNESYLVTDYSAQNMIGGYSRTTHAALIEYTGNGIDITGEYVSKKDLYNAHSNEFILVKALDIDKVTQFEKSLK